MLAAFLFDLALGLIVASPLSNVSTFYSRSGVWIALILSVTGLIIGLFINILSKFRRAIAVYILGHILSIVLLSVVSEIYVGKTFGDDTDQDALPIIEAYDDTSAIFGTNDKHAIEEVIFLMEQQYPFGEYELIDVQTEYKNNDSANIYCTLVFSLKAEGTKKYISQYIVKNGSVQPVYTKQDSTSGAYQAYRMRHEAR